MKNGTKLTALLVAILMLLSTAAFGEMVVENTGDEAAEPVESAASLADDQLILTVNGHPILKADFDNMAQTLESYGYSGDYVTAYSYLLQNELFKYAFEKYGLNDFTEEEKAAFLAEAEQLLEENYQSYVDYFKTSEEPTEEELAELRSQAEAYFRAYGYTADVVAESLEESACYDKLEAYMTETFELDVSDEDVEAAFAAIAEEDKAMYEGQVPMYEFYTQYYGTDSYYVPEGYRGVLQILLKVDDALLEDYAAKQAAYEEQLSGETEDETETEADAEDGEAAQASPVTAEDVEQARQAILDAARETIDQINGRLANGESFIDLIPEYNIDPGMQNEYYLSNGYLVHRESIMFDPAFISAAFDENMNQIGDVSAPSVGTYGIYIVYYLRDAGGVVEMTDEIADELTGTLKTEKLNAKYGELIAEWQDESEIIYEEEAFTQLTGIGFVDGKPALDAE